MVAVKAHTYNAFASPTAAGNPAAVIVLPKTDIAEGQTVTQSNGDSFPYELSPPDSTLQAIAKQIGLPMTAFLIPLKASPDGSDTADYAVRWFNPASEAPLCGHATLALSHHLFSTLPNPPQSLLLQTRLHGIVSASLYSSPFEDEKLVGIKFPEAVDLVTVTRGAERWNQLKEAFEAATSSAWSSSGEPMGLYECSDEVLLEYSPEIDLKALQVDLAKLSAVSPKIDLFQISAQQTEHIHTRVFNTGAHAHEDIATGSAHRVIIPLVLSNAETRERLLKYHPSFTGNTLRVAQKSSEGGELTVEWLQDEKMALIMGKVFSIDETTVEIPLE